ncbi:hypothetical protein AURDEDRAFT_172328 [Auricularia subglabra TFB-10046 SS5]|nr:hypothetical protein AURDEDRAFT_172328 [Auricularia subglabra TFB-10046 SS5]
MRESNFAFPAQNRACVCISSQLYDRRALDTTSALPLFNSLSHLTYLTSTSPRIREILTFDGGLERLVRILRDFCQAPPPPESPQTFYGLMPPAPPSGPSKKPGGAPADVKNFDRAAAYRFSLAFQCVANIGVRGSEPIRSRVVQAGTLDVVGCVLESWLQSKGFAVLPSSSASGLPRESKEQRLARRQQLAQQQQAQQAAEIARALERARQIQEASSLYHAVQPAAPPVNLPRRPHHHHHHHHHAQLSVSAGPSNSTSASDEEMADVSPAQTRPSSSVSMNSLHSVSSGNGSGADTSAHATPVGSSTPTGTVVVSATRDRSGTVVAPRPTRPSSSVSMNSLHSVSSGNGSGADTSAHATPVGSSTPTGTVVVSATRDRSGTVVAPRPVGGGPNNRRRARTVTQRNRLATDTEDEDVEMGDDEAGGRRAVGIVQGDDADDGTHGHLNLLIDGIVALGQDDDLAMGAPPGAPGATAAVPAQTQEAVEEEEDTDMAPSETPRQTMAPLPQPVLAPTPRPSVQVPRMEDGPYREEDVLIALQLLAYLSKYPHVFYILLLQYTLLLPTCFV